MSAVEALAEVLAKHGPLEDDCGFVEACDCGWVGGWKDQLGHATTALVAAIRSMPAEQVAELIDGEVGYWTFYANGAPYAEIRPQGDHSPERIAARHVKEGTHVERRVQGPWLPLGVSPETNGGATDGDV